MNECKIEGSFIFVSQKGFMNSRIFIKWLVHLENSFPDIVKIPLVLVYDAYSLQYNNVIVEKAIELSIILVLLLDNATNLIQPLDITVFNTFKMIPKRKMHVIIN